MVCMDYNGPHVWGRDALSYNIDQEAKERLINAVSLRLALCQHKELLTFPQISWWGNDRNHVFPAFLSTLLGKICVTDSNMVKCEKHPHLDSSFDILGRSCNHAAESCLNATVKNWCYPKSIHQSRWCFSQCFCDLLWWFSVRFQVRRSSLVCNIS